MNFLYPIIILNYNTPVIASRNQYLHKMSFKKRYEILESLPVYGPMYVSVPDTSWQPYSEGYVVRLYKDDGTDWVANFESGGGRLNTVIELQDQIHLLIIAYGSCYIMNPNSQVPIKVFGYSYDKVLPTQKGDIVLYGYNDITIMKPDGSYHDLNIWFDGIRNVSVEGNILKGETNDYTDIWRPFEYNLDTKELKTTGNWTYAPQDTIVHPAKHLIKKPWWKFW